jgi:hypothetical protein
MGAEAPGARETAWLARAGFGAVAAAALSLPAALTSAPARAAGLGLALTAAAVLAVFTLSRMRRRTRGTTRSDADTPGAALLDVRSGCLIPIAKPVVTIGRDSGNDIVLRSPTVSADHARIEVRGRRFCVRDLRSTNGTFVNGARATGATVLTDGDRVAFDELNFEFVAGPGGTSPTLVRQPALPPAPDGAGRARPRRHRNAEVEMFAATHRLVTCPVHPGERAVGCCARCGAPGCARCGGGAGEALLCAGCASPAVEHATP